MFFFEIFGNHLRYLKFAIVLELTRANIKTFYKRQFLLFLYAVPLLADKVLIHILKYIVYVIEVWYQFFHIFSSYINFLKVFFCNINLKNIFSGEKTLQCILCISWLYSRSTFKMCTYIDVFLILQSWTITILSCKDCARK